MTGIVGYITGSSTSREKREEIIHRGVRWNLSNPYTDDDLYHHFRLRDAVLNQMCDDGKILPNQFDQVEDFYVNFTKQLITFTRPGTSDRVAVAFEDVKSKRAISDLNYFIGRANTELFYGHKVPLIGSSRAKSNATGPAPLQRKSPAANALTNDFAEARQTILPAMLAQAPDVASTRQKIVKRVEHAEFVAYRMKREIRTKLQEKSQEIQILQNTRPQPADADRQIRVLRKEISDLRNLFEQFNNLDVYALTTALSALPVGRYGYDALERATVDVQNRVRADLVANLGRSRWSLRKQKLNASDETYIKSVAGLLHKTRGEYATYCQRQKMKLEKESLEDLILREALRVSDGREFQDEDIKGAVSLRMMSPELQTEVAGMFDYLDRLSGVDAYFPRDTRTYSGDDQTVLSGQIASRYNSISMDGRDAPARRHRVFNTRNALITAGIGGAIIAGEAMGLEPVRRIADMGQLALSNPGSAVGTAFMGLMGLNHARRWWASRDQLPYVIAGGAMLTGMTMHALGTMDPTEVFQVAINNPATSVALVSTAHAVTRAAYDYVRPVTGPETGLYTRRQRQMNWGRAAMVLGVGTAVTLGGVSLYQYMFAEDEEEQNQALGYLTETVDMVWNHCIIASITIPMVKRVVDSHIGGTIGKVSSGALGVLESVAKVGQTYHFAAGVLNRVSGYFSWTSTPALTGGSTDLSAGPVVEELTEGGAVPLPSIDSPPPTSEDIVYTIGGQEVCRNPALVSAPDVIALTASAASDSWGGMLWNGTKWLATESSRVFNQTKTGEMVARIFKPAFQY